MITIEKISNIEIYDYDKKKTATLPGWVFLDEHGRTIIQAFGEWKKELIKDILNV